MAETCLYAEKTPLVDLDAYRLVEYEADLKAKYYKNEDVLFDETKEWCETWYCPVADSGFILPKLVAFIKRVVKELLELALTVIYTLLDSLVSILTAIVGPIAKLVDDVLIFVCYIAIFIANLFLPPESKLSYSASCCGASSFLEILESFIQSICDEAIDVYKRMLKTWHQICGLYELLSHACYCEKIKEEDYQTELDVIKNQNGDQYEYIVNVPPPCVEVGTIVSSDTGIPDPLSKKPSFYIKVTNKDPKVSQFFMQHVEYTILAYNKWPYGVDGFCPMRASSYGMSFVTWQRYVAFLVANWLSSSNIYAEKTNPYGYSYKEHAAQMNYCMAHMPKELFNYVVSCVSDTEKINKKYWGQENGD